MPKKPQSKRQKILGNDFLNIGKLKTEGYAALAPMAGVADRAFRELCMGFGASFCIGELASAKGISMNDKKSAELLFVSENERPMAVQLFGNDPETMAAAAQKALEYFPDFIDINMGCPAPKVANNNGGSGLLRDLPLAESIAKAVIKAVPHIPVTAKIRAGWNDKEIVAVELAKRLEQAGVSMITVHGRTREQQYAPPVNLNVIADVKKTVSVPVVGNGDIFSAKDAANMFEQTGCDMVMVGRGAMGAPWIFRQINTYLSEGKMLPDPPISRKMELMLRQARLMCEYKDPRTALLQMRKHAAWYIKGMKGAAELRKRAFKITDISELERLAYDIVKEEKESVL